MERPHNRTHCSAPEKGIGKNRWAPVAPSSFLQQDYSKTKNVQNRFSSSTTVGCGMVKSSGFSTSHWRGFLLSLFLFPFSQPLGERWRNIFCCESRCGVRRAGSTGEWLFGSPDELKQHKNFDQFAQLHMLCKVPLLAALFLSTLVSLLMKPPSCKARFYCRKSNGGGKCLVFNALLFQFHDCCFKC